MQELTLYREIISNKAILGTLKLDNVELCKTLENPWLNNLPDISCIPEGKYVVCEFNGTKYKDVWEVRDVKGRTYILIHNGNTESETEGCILVGDVFGFLGDDIAVINSVATLNKLRKRLDDNFILNIVNSI